MMDGEGGRVFFFGRGRKGIVFSLFLLAPSRNGRRARLQRPHMPGRACKGLWLCQTRKRVGVEGRGPVHEGESEEARAAPRTRARAATSPPLPINKKNHLSHRHSRASSSGVHGSRLADGASGSGRLREGMCVYVRAGASGGKERDVLLSDGSKQPSA
jgi:hypothetical protein